jgi:hypothetical protein
MQGKSGGTLCRIGSLLAGLSILTGAFFLGIPAVILVGCAMMVAVTNIQLTAGMVIIAAIWLRIRHRPGELSKLLNALILCLLIGICVVWASALALTIFHDAIGGLWIARVEHLVVEIHGFLDQVSTAKHVFLTLIAIALLLWMQKAFPIRDAFSRAVRIKKMIAFVALVVATIASFTFILCVPIDNLSSFYYFNQRVIYKALLRDELEDTATIEAANGIQASIVTLDSSTLANFHHVMFAIEQYSGRTVKVVLSNYARADAAGIAQKGNRHTPVEVEAGLDSIVTAEFGGEPGMLHQRLEQERLINQERLLAERTRGERDRRVTAVCESFNTLVESAAKPMLHGLAGEYLSAFIAEMASIYAEEWFSGKNRKRAGEPAAAINLASALLLAYSIEGGLARLQREIKQGEESRNRIYDLDQPRKREEAIEALLEGEVPDSASKRVPGVRPVSRLSGRPVVK